MWHGLFPSALTTASSTLYKGLIHDQTISTMLLRHFDRVWNGLSSCATVLNQACGFRLRPKYFVQCSVIDKRFERLCPCLTSVSGESPLKENVINKFFSIQSLIWGHSTNFFWNLVRLKYVFAHSYLDNDRCYRTFRLKKFIIRIWRLRTLSSLIARIFLIFWTFVH